MMQVATQDGAVYSLEFEDLGSHSRVLAISRVGGTDDPPVSNKPMVEGRRYHVHVLSPLPPRIGQRLDMILDPVLDDLLPIVRRTGMVTSVVGLLEAPRHRDASDAADLASAPPIVPSDPAVSYVADRSGRSWLDGRGKLSKTAGMLAAVLGAAVLFGRRR